MKRVYRGLQQLTIPLSLHLGMAPVMPIALQKAYGGQLWAAELYCWFLLLTSGALFGLCMLWLKSKFLLNRPGYMAALSFGSALGAMIGFSALLGIYGYGTKLYQLWKDVPASVLIGLMLLGVLWELTRPRGSEKT